MSPLSVQSAGSSILMPLAVYTMPPALKGAGTARDKSWQSPRQKTAEVGPSAKASSISLCGAISFRASLAASFWHSHSRWNIESGCARQSSHTGSTS